VCGDASAADVVTRTRIDDRFGFRFECGRQVIDIGIGVRFRRSRCRFDQSSSEVNY
jgi:hypothetical protein